MGKRERGKDLLLFFIFNGLFILAVYLFFIRPPLNEYRQMTEIVRLQEARLSIKERNRDAQNENRIFLESYESNPSRSDFLAGAD